jgi:hypothetical protein
VTKDIAPGDHVWGFPARTLRATLQQMASVSRLPALLKMVTGLLARLGCLEGRLERLERRQPRQPPDPS